MNQSELLYGRAVKVMPGGVNSPVRAYRAVGMAPRFITRADGAYLWDEDGTITVPEALRPYMGGKDAIR